MATWVGANIGLANGLLPDGTMSLHKQLPKYLFLKNCVGTDSPNQMPLVFVNYVVNPLCQNWYNRMEEQWITVA